MKATIYYNMLGHPGEDAFAKKIWRATHNNVVVNISDTQFKNNWTKMPKKEIVSKELKNRDLALDYLYGKYNNYVSNPYSNSNDKGQIIIKKLKVRHTSMMVGDIIEIDNTYYMVSSEGFIKVIIL